ncbi:MAG: HlyD family efflux transporter periplasmic adaptor subunit [Candidatus Zixiibacteriota bacterium]|nr:MAG: HlyD family efflux transporter periplasmic adaptor subunit [candidate division Zixibacteria bacterium]
MAGIAAVILVLLFGTCALRSIITPTVDGSRISTSIAELGSVEATVSASGVVVPEFEQLITSPVSSTIEQVFIRPGDTVKTGEQILRLNKELLDISLKKLQDELEIQKNKKEQLTLKLERTEIELKSAYEIKDLQTKFVQSQYDRVKHLYDIGGATEEDLDRAALNVQIARSELQQLAKQIDNQQASLRADLKGLDLEISIQANRVGEVERQLQLAETRAGLDGVVTWVNDNIGQTVAPGDALARVADLGSFRIEARISDAHAAKLVVGGPVKVRIGNGDFRGHISSVQPSVQEGVISFLVQLDQKSDPALRPNLRTDVYVITSCRDSVVRVENGPFYTGTVDQEVFVVRGDHAVRRIVNIGASNFDWVEIDGDIVPGDEVIISDMRDYRHMDEVEIE